MNVTCASLHEYLCDFVGGELCAESCASIRAHLLRCPPCMMLVEQYQLTIQAGRCLPLRPVPEKLLERLKQSLGE